MNEYTHGATDALTAFHEYTHGATDALTAFRGAIEDMAREDIDGETGTVTYRDLLGGIDAAIAVADAFTPPDPFSRKV